MKQKHIRQSVLVSSVALAVLSAGCASMAVSNDAIEQRTAVALGMPKGAFTISDRVDDGVRSSYMVKTNAGKQYSCYVTGSVSYTGRTVSDAICSGLGKANRQTTGAGGGACNALLRAAGKC